jgi:large subunit ribosomal protein L2
MGKRLIVQRRGRGGSTYRSPSHRHRGGVKYRKIDEAEKTGDVKARVMALIHDPGRTAPVAEVKYENGEKDLVLVSEGTAVGQEIRCGKSTEMKQGNIMSIGEITEGTPIFNIEGKPGDGGKLVRSAGTYAMLIAHDVNKSIVQLPSGVMKDFNPLCRATIGVVAGGGRREKPMLKAGKKFHSIKATAKHWPKVRGVAMNVINHPYGGGSKQSAGKADSVSRTAPPGRKVGIIAPKRTGKR